MTTVQLATQAPHVQPLLRPCPWRFLFATATVLGLASGLRIYFTHQALGVDTTLLVGLSSGLMDWFLWLPVAPVVLGLAHRFDTELPTFDGLGRPRADSLDPESPLPARPPRPEHAARPPRAARSSRRVYLSIRTGVGTVGVHERQAVPFDTAQGGGAPVLIVHALASAPASFAQLALFAVASGLVRTWRFGDAFHVDLSSPLFVKLAPGMAIYWIMVLGWWRHTNRARPEEAGTRAEPGQTGPSLEFQAGRATLRLAAEEIDRVEAAGNYIELHANGQTHVVRETLTGTHAKLGEGFVRIHRSTLVRREAIVGLAPGGARPVVLLRDGTRLPVGRKFRDRLQV